MTYHYESNTKAHGPRANNVHSAQDTRCEVHT